MSSQQSVLFVLVGATPLCESLRTQLSATEQTSVPTPSAGGRCGSGERGPACLLVRAEDLAGIDTPLEEWMHATARSLAVLQGRYSQLTRRERQALPLITEGMLNKQAASLLGISEATLQIHRGRIMQKMGARSFAELVRIADLLGIGHDAGCKGRDDASSRWPRAWTLPRRALIEKTV